MIAERVRGAVIRDSVVRDAASAFVKVQGASSDVSLFNNDAAKAKALVSLADGLAPSVVFKSGNKEQ
jgi:hypothetical protein